MSARRFHTARALSFSGVIAFLNSDLAAAQASSLPIPWSTQDIGNPAIAGSTSFDQGTTERTRSPSPNRRVGKSCSPSRGVEPVCALSGPALAGRFR